MHEARNLDSYTVVDSSSKPYAWRGEDALIRSIADEKARNTINTLAGRIFAVRFPTPNNPDNEKPTIMWSGSGILMPTSVDKAQEPQFETILTCKHVMAIHEDLVRSYQFYFVRSEGLDPNTGLPKGVENNEDAAQYLVQVQDNYTRTISDPISFKEGEDFEDSAYSCKVNIPFELEMRNMIGVKKLTLPDLNMGEPYYAVGYPNVLYLEKFPLTIATSKGVGTPESDKVKHYAPTPQGMSGGPIIMVDKLRGILLIGVVGKGMVYVTEDKEDKFFFAFS